MPSNRTGPVGEGNLWPGLEQLGECQNPTLRWILDGFDANFEKKLHELKTTWNQKIRGYYREVLSLNTRESPLHVTWKLDDNGAFIRIVEDKYPDLDFAALVAFRRYLAEVEHVKVYFADFVAQESLAQTRQYAEESLKAYDLKEIVSTLFEFYQRRPDSDVFGRYYLRNHAIEIYIIPCIVFSMLIEEDFLDMSIGTLAHELAHGFHHAGADKDGFTWSTFGQTDAALLEGLAEFYTREFSRSVQGARPQVLRAFEKTASYLPPDYRRYEEWSAEHGLETVYQAFIETRRAGIRSFEDFGNGLSEAGRRLKAG